jgi:pyruvate/2-oxoglutarate dehydrogenase complex dihydrolipoamide acyltransferase (E2) component
VPTPLYTPRINNNDDTVRLTKVLAAIGSPLRTGDAILDIETDKASFTVEAEQDGYLLIVLANPGDTIGVGSLLAWIGSSPDESIPANAMGANGAAPAPAGTSLKAALLLAQYGLDAASVNPSGARLSAAGVQQYIDSRGLRPASAARPPSPRSQPTAPGDTVDLTPQERGMLRTVEWHRQEAAPAYVELASDPAPWQQYAAEYQKSKNLLVSPLLSLLAWKLVQIARQHPEINATITGESRYLYRHVNLGFTVQSGERLYVVVVPQAESLSEAEFVARLSALQRAAMKHALSPQDTSGATIGFSSMARWNVTRHMPILLPHTSLMVAHAGAATCGATYDHRALSGWQAVQVLQALAQPPENL